MVEHGAAVTAPLGVIHEGTDVVLLAMVTDPRADYHGNVICQTQTHKVESCVGVKNGRCVCVDFISG